MCPGFEDGRHSKNCKRLIATFDDCVIDHKDGSKHHNCLRNLQLMTVPCNVKKGEMQGRQVMVDQERDPTWLTSKLDLENEGMQKHKLTCNLCRDPVAPATLPPTDPADSAKKRAAIIDREVGKPEESPSMRANRINQTIYRNTLRMLVLSGEEVTTRRAIYGIAKRKSIPSATCKRYFLEETDPHEGDFYVDPITRLVKPREDKPLSPEMEMIKQLADELKTLQKTAAVSRQDSSQAMEVLKAITGKTDAEIMQMFSKAKIGRGRDSTEWPICLICSKKRMMPKEQFVCDDCTSRFKEASNKVDK